MSLTEQLAAKKAQSAEKIPAATREIMEKNTQALIQEHLSEKASKTGETLADFELPDALGHTVRLQDLRAQGFVVISFYRGGWCPYCNLELRALQNILPQLKDFNAQLVAISPESPDNSLSTQEKNELAFPVLSDADNGYARQLGLVFEFADDLKEVYQGFGFDLPKRHKSDKWELPMPATYVISPEGKVLLSFVSEDYRQRLEPEDILSLLKQEISVS